MVIWLTESKGFESILREEGSKNPEVWGLRDPIPTGIICEGDGDTVLCFDTSLIMPVVAVSPGCPLCEYHRHTGELRTHYDARYLNIGMFYRDHEFYRDYEFDFKLH